MAVRLAAFKRRAARAGVPVIYVNDNFGKWRSDFRQTVAHCTRPSSPGRNVSMRLRPTARDYFVLKPKHSGFHDTTLDTLLRDLRTRRVIVCRHRGQHLRALHRQRRLHARAADPGARRLHRLEYARGQRRGAASDQGGAERQPDRLGPVDLSAISAVTGARIASCKRPRHGTRSKNRQLVVLARVRRAGPVSQARQGHPRRRRGGGWRHHRPDRGVSPGGGWQIRGAPRARAVRPGRDRPHHRAPDHGHGHAAAGLDQARRSIARPGRLGRRPRRRRADRHCRATARHRLPLRLDRRLPARAVGAHRWAAGRRAGAAVPAGSGAGGGPGVRCRVRARRAGHRHTGNPVSRSGAISPTAVPGGAGEGGRRVRGSNLRAHHSRRVCREVRCRSRRTATP